ncbi:MAG: hypothetical protein P0Y63_24920 [Klebsiella huaxiensis]|uniref:hypothetical protein n=1 Tax=Klebsiella huaxiensis TaxID=2153354 RepID=UPI0026F187E7|nr:hypothetical protein [Klebsiella huaxiensis]WEJ88487.1 MAG: hypothetical protein P0Y63_24920 [Klebsiella huaxiensis]
MKTVKELKALIDYFQTDEVFYDYLEKLVEADVISINAGDLDKTNGAVSDDFFELLARVYGVEISQSGEEDTWQQD